MRMTPRVIVKKLIRRWSISPSARYCDRHALLMISWLTTMSQKNVSDNGSDWCSDTTRRDPISERDPYHPTSTYIALLVGPSVPKHRHKHISVSYFYKYNLISLLVLILAVHPVDCS